MEGKKEKKGIKRNNENISKNNQNDDKVTKTIVLDDSFSESPIKKIKTNTLVIINDSDYIEEKQNKTINLDTSNSGDFLHSQENYVENQDTNEVMIEKNYEENKSEFKKTTKNILDEIGVAEVELGDAKDDGDCFFDAIAIEMNRAKINNKNDYNVKKLRAACKAFYAENRNKVDAWLVNSNWSSNSQNYNDVIFDKDESDKRNSNLIWGRSDVEGRILSEVYQLKGLLMGELKNVNDQDILNFELVEKIDDYQLKNVDDQRKIYLQDAAILKIVVNQKTLHFAPLLDKNTFDPPKQTQESSFSFENKSTLSQSLRRLDSLAKILEINNECVAVFLKNKSILITSNDIDAPINNDFSQAANIRSIVYIMNYFLGDVKYRSEHKEIILNYILKKKIDEYASRQQKKSIEKLPSKIWSHIIGTLLEKKGTKDYNTTKFNKSLRSFLKNTYPGDENERIRNDHETDARLIIKHSWELIRHFKKASKFVDVINIDKAQLLAIGDTKKITVGKNKREVTAKEHAELKMLFYLLKKHPNYFKNTFGENQKKVYIGISMLCCDNCHNIITLLNDTAKKNEINFEIVIDKSSDLAFEGWKLPNYTDIAIDDMNGLMLPIIFDKNRSNNLIYEGIKENKSNLPKGEKLPSKEEDFNLDESIYSQKSKEDIKFDEFLLDFNKKLDEYKMTPKKKRSKEEGYANMPGTPSDSESENDLELDFEHLIPVTFNKQNNATYNSLLGK